MLSPLELMGVSIRGRGHRVDLSENKLSIEWEVLCEPLGGGVDPALWEPPDYAVGAHAVDVYLTDTSGNILTNDPAKLLDYNHFETKHNIRPLEQLPVPFDSYIFHAYAFAINPVTNQSVDIVKFSVPDPPSGFTVSSSEIGVAKPFTYATDDGPGTVEIKPRMLTVAIRYSVFTVALTTCMFVTNWILTLATLYITSSAMARGTVSWLAFMLHNSLVLVIPSIRKLYLCPPPFGMFLDTAGFFSQMIVLSSCSIALLYYLLVPPKLRKPSTQISQKS